MFDLLAAPKTELLVKQLDASFLIWKDKFEINTPERKAMLVAQTAHETGGYIWMHELGSDQYLQYLENRADLGNDMPGDGPKYKGRGIIQLTGKGNYDFYGTILGIDLLNHPEQAEDPDIAIQTALLFWKKHGLNDLSDQKDVEAVTRKINGGINGLTDRQNKFELMLKTLQAQSLEPSTIGEDI